MQAKSKGFHSNYDIGVKYAEKQKRQFNQEQLREGRNVIGLQVSTEELLSFIYLRYAFPLCESLWTWVLSVTSKAIGPLTKSIGCANIVQ